MTHENWVEEGEVAHYTDRKQNHPNWKSQFLKPWHFISEHQSCQENDESKRGQGRSRGVVENCVN